MSIAANQPVTVGATLFAADDAEAALAHELRLAGIVTEIVRLVDDLDATKVHDDTAHGAAQILDLDVVDILVAAWAAKGALSDAARLTASDPCRTEHVKLLSQRIAWSWAPSIDLVVDERMKGTIELELELSFDIALLEAKVRGGRLMALSSGDCELTASLTIQKHKLPEQKRHVDLRLTVPLPADGIPLVHSAEPGSPPPATMSGPAWVGVSGRPAIAVPSASS
jgi:hypothetical protein